MPLPEIPSLYKNLPAKKESPTEVPPEEMSLNEQLSLERKKALKALNSYRSRDESDKPYETNSSGFRTDEQIFM